MCTLFQFIHLLRSMKIVGYFAIYLKRVQLIAPEISIRRVANFRTHKLPIEWNFQYR